MNKGYVTIYNPKQLIIGPGTIASMVDDVMANGLKRLLVVTVPKVFEQTEKHLKVLEKKGVAVKVHFFDKGEPTFGDYEEIRAVAKNFKADSIAGIGGGSVMDISKIVAALLNTNNDVRTVVGKGLIKEKGVYTICVPTTSGTGSEVSPNSILMEDGDFSKKGIISPYLVPDAAFVDPELTVSLPPSVTANTGLDALTHCIEAYANKNAHPLVDTFALSGIKLICNNILKAVRKGDDLEARTNLAMGSVYGGMCLGPVNTAAVHALAYPLGSDYKIPHGQSNAVLLPYVMEYNLEHGTDRYAQIAVAAGAARGHNDLVTAKNGIELIKQLVEDCDIPQRLSQLDIPESAIPKMAEGAMQVQRLLKNNIRQINKEDAIKIYKNAF